MTIESKHADILNALDEMQKSPHYALRRDVLRSAERIITEQEAEINRLVEFRKKSLCALKMAEEELEFDELYAEVSETGEGRYVMEALEAVRASIKNAEGA